MCTRCPSSRARLTESNTSKAAVGARAPSSPIFIARSRALSSCPWRRQRPERSSSVTSPTKHVQTVNVKLARKHAQRSRAVLGAPHVSYERGAMLCGAPRGRCRAHHRVAERVQIRAGSSARSRCAPRPSARLADASYLPQAPTASSLRRSNRRGAARERGASPPRSLRRWSALPKGGAGGGFDSLQDPRDVLRTSPSSLEFPNSLLSSSPQFPLFVYCGFQNSWPNGESVVPVWPPVGLPVGARVGARLA